MLFHEFVVLGNYAKALPKAIGASQLIDDTKSSLRFFSLECFLFSVKNLVL
jgi:hypothetical protein